MEKLVDAAENKKYEFVETLKDRNRGLILLLLEKISKTGNKELITLLKAWQIIEYKKVRTKIQEVIELLEKEEESSNEVVSFSANKKWLSIPVEIRRKLEQNVWCVSCSDVVQIERYTVKELSTGIVLEGKCQKCGHDVARVFD